MNRKLIWGASAALLLGLLAVLFGYFAPAQTATVTGSGRVYAVQRRRNGRARRSVSYRTTLSVTWRNDRGEDVSAEVPFIAAHERDIPKAGDRIGITSWLGGMVPHPNRTLIRFGAAGTVLGGTALAILLLVKWCGYREKRKAEASAARPSGEERRK